MQMFTFFLNLCRMVLINSSTGQVATILQVGFVAIPIYLVVQVSSSRFLSKWWLALLKR